MTAENAILHGSPRTFMPSRVRLYTTKKAPARGAFGVVEKERFELQASNRIYAHCIKICANKCDYSVTKYQIVKIRANPLSVKWWYRLVLLDDFVKHFHAKRRKMYMKQENKNCIELPYTTHDDENELDYRGSPGLS